MRLPRIALFLSVIILTASAFAQEKNRTWITDVTIISPENLDHISPKFQSGSDSILLIR